MDGPGGHYYWTNGNIRNAEFYPSMNGRTMTPHPPQQPFHYPVNFQQSQQPYQGQAVYPGGQPGPAPYPVGQQHQYVHMVQMPNVQHSPVNPPPPPPTPPPMSYSDVCATVERICLQKPKGITLWNLEERLLSILPHPLPAPLHQFLEGAIQTEEICVRIEKDIVYHNHNSTMVIQEIVDSDASCPITTNPHSSPTSVHNQQIILRNSSWVRPAQLALEDSCSSVVRRHPEWIVRDYGNSGECREEEIREMEQDTVEEEERGEEDAKSDSTLNGEDDRESGSETMSEEEREEEQTVRENIEEEEEEEEDWDSEMNEERIEEQTVREHIVEGERKEGDYLSETVHEEEEQTVREHAEERGRRDGEDSAEATVRDSASPLEKEEEYPVYRVATISENTDLEETDDDISLNSLSSLSTPLYDHHHHFVYPPPTPTPNPASVSLPPSETTVPGSTVSIAGSDSRIASPSSVLSDDSLIYGTGEFMSDVEKAETETAHVSDFSSTDSSTVPIPSTVPVPLFSPPVIPPTTVVQSSAAPLSVASPLPSEPTPSAAPLLSFGASSTVVQSSSEVQPSTVPVISTSTVHAPSSTTTDPPSSIYTRRRLTKMRAPARTSESDASVETLQSTVHPASPVLLPEVPESVLTSFAVFSTAPPPDVIQSSSSDGSTPSLNPSKALQPSLLQNDLTSSHVIRTASPPQDGYHAVSDGAFSSRHSDTEPEQSIVLQPEAPILTSSTVFSTSLPWDQSEVKEHFPVLMDSLLPESPSLIDILNDEPTSPSYSTSSGDSIVFLPTIPSTNRRPSVPLPPPPMVQPGKKKVVSQVPPMTTPLPLVQTSSETAIQASSPLPPPTPVDSEKKKEQGMESSISSLTPHEPSSPAPSRNECSQEKKSEKVLVSASSSRSESEKISRGSGKSVDAFVSQRQEPCSPSPSPSRRNCSKEKKSEKVLVSASSSRSESEKVSRGSRKSVDEFVSQPQEPCSPSPLRTDCSEKEKSKKTFVSPLPRTKSPARCENEKSETISCGSRGERDAFEVPPLSSSSPRPPRQYHDEKKDVTTDLDVSVSSSNTLPMGDVHPFVNKVNREIKYHNDGHNKLPTQQSHVSTVGHASETVTHAMMDSPVEVAPSVTSVTVAATRHTSQIVTFAPDDASGHAPESVTAAPVHANGTAPQPVTRVPVVTVSRHASQSFTAEPVYSTSNALPTVTPVPVNTASDHAPQWTTFAPVHATGNAPQPLTHVPVVSVPRHVPVSVPSVQNVRTNNGDVSDVRNLQLPIIPIDNRSLPLRTRMDFVAQCRRKWCAIEPLDEMIHLLQKLHQILPILKVEELYGCITELWESEYPWLTFFGLNSVEDLMKYHLVQWVTDQDLVTYGLTRKNGMKRKWVHVNHDVIKAECVQIVDFLAISVTDQLKDKYKRDQRYAADLKQLTTIVFCDTSAVRFAAVSAREPILRAIVAAYPSIFHIDKMQRMGRADRSYTDHIVMNDPPPFIVQSVGYSSADAKKIEEEADMYVEDER